MGSYRLDMSDYFEQSHLSLYLTASVRFSSAALSDYRKDRVVVGTYGKPDKRRMASATAIPFPLDDDMHTEDAHA